ncbi:hypothetical protein [Blastococcus sp. URHD0036]|uniref:hypothetical protein n=1 Tax=Blastococcus sp. URHD0036 TaxID=1380356 RepID=UPI00054E67E5|nr:hypothetical protein [Blastococcus sp. URHD0036]
MRRDPREARLLGLWTAGCLAVLLLAGILAFGDLSLQWPVFVVPLVWALVAARPRRGTGRDALPEAEPFPATREAPTLPRVPPERLPRDW